VNGGVRLAMARFPVMLRRRASLILGVSIAFLVASLLGVALGRSAIAEINPVHFRGAAERPHAIDPNAGARVPDAYASAYGFGDGHAARAADCGGDCNAREARDAGVVSTPVRPRPASGPYWRDATAVTEPRPWPAGEVGPQALSVERYMHYPVETSTETAAEVEDDKPEGAESAKE
jgi:hypothetical protein